MKLLPLWLLICAIYGCKKDEVITPQRGPDDYYIEFDLNGVKKEYIGNPDLGYNYYPGLGYYIKEDTVAFTNDSLSNYTYCLFKAVTAPSSKEQVEIVFNVLDSTGTNHSLFSAVLKPGPLPYIQEDMVNWHTGFEVYYYDASRKIWSTNYSGPGQSASTATITSIQTDTYLGRASFSARVTFNCILYDGLGGSLTITNGHAHVRGIDELFR